MAYKLVISERADEQIDRLVAYLIHELKNPDAAIHFLNELEDVYRRMEENPFQFPDCKDRRLFLLGYKEALFERMSYRVIFRTEKSSVYILGVFHLLEDFGKKIQVN